MNRESRTGSQPAFVCQQGEREPRGAYGSEAPYAEKADFFLIQLLIFVITAAGRGTREEEPCIPSSPFVFLSIRETLRPPQGLETKLHFFPRAGQAQPARMSSSSSSSTVHRPNPTFVLEFQLSGEGGPVHPKGPPLEELLPGEPGPHSCWEAQQYKCSNTHPHMCHGQFWEPRALCPLLRLISGQQLPLPVSSPGRHGVTDSCQRRA